MIVVIVWVCTLSLMMIVASIALIKDSENRVRKFNNKPKTK